MTITSRTDWAAEPVRVAAPLRQQVIDSMRQAILNFQLKPGQRLVERELMEQLMVSRTTVREAIRELTSEGLVTVVPQKGAIVSTLSHEEAADLYDIRASIESLAVRKFVAKASEEQVRQLRATVDELDAVTRKTEDILSVLHAKDKFYGVLFEGAGSPALQQIIEGIQARVRLLRASSLSSAGRNQEAVAELKAVVDAIKARDAELAAQLCATHVKNAAATGLKNIDAGGREMQTA